MSLRGGNASAGRAASTPVPSAAGSTGPDRRALHFVTLVVAVIAIVIVTTFYAYSLHPPPATLPDNVIFADVTMANGNASFTVQNTSGGPYPAAEFRTKLIVNNFASPSEGLVSNPAFTRITIGPNTYRIVWIDSDADRTVSTGDSFVVSGDGMPLPSISAYEFDLQWEGAWIAKAFWTTS